MSRKKLKSNLTSKKFFSSFSCWDDLIMFFKPKKNFMKKVKKKFFGSNRPSVFSAQWSAFNYTVFRLARIDRKNNGGYIDSFIEKIRWEEHLYFYKKKTKNVQAWTLRHREDLTYAGTNGLRERRQIIQNFWWDPFFDNFFSIFNWFIKWGYFLLQ